MLKYIEEIIGFAEIPDEISLCINISNCPYLCFNCHSPKLREDIGTPLTYEVLDKLIKKNDGITCICFLGGSNDISALNDLLNHCFINWGNIKTAVYLGDKEIPPNLNLKVLDYIKIGPYIENLGPINNPRTNQKLYEINHELNTLNNITYKFWENESI